MGLNNPECRDTVVGEHRAVLNVRYDRGERAIMPGNGRRRTVQHI